MNSAIKVKKRQEIFLVAYEKAMGNVTEACRATGISRSAYHHWMRIDEEFKKKVEDLAPDEVMVDIAEKAIMKKIREGDTASIIFTLKSKGKKRGWVERLESVNKTSVQFDPEKYEKILEKNLGAPADKDVLE